VSTLEGRSASVGALLRRSSFDYKPIYGALALARA
jgi:hypothetical protein